MSSARASPEEACVAAMEEVHGIVDDARLSCVAFNNRGVVAAASTNREPPLYYMDDGMDEVETRKGVCVRK